MASNSQEPIYYIVSRELEEDKEAKLLEALHSGKSKEDIDKLCEKVAARKVSYSGQYFKNRFRVNHAIQLVGLGFYGPYTEESAKYTIDVELYKPKDLREISPLETTSELISKLRQTMTAKKKELFYVEFEPESIVVIQPNVWHLIQFKLDGPATFNCSATLNSAEVPITDEKRKIKFEFDLGSKQMPTLKFRLS